MTLEEQFSETRSAGRTPVTSNNQLYLTALVEIAIGDARHSVLLSGRRLSHDKQSWDFKVSGYGWVNFDKLIAAERLALIETDKSAALVSLKLQDELVKLRASMQRRKS